MSPVCRPRSAGFVVVDHMLTIIRARSLETTWRRRGEGLHISFKAPSGMFPHDPTHGHHRPGSDRHRSSRNPPDRPTSGRTPTSGSRRRLGSRALDWACLFEHYATDVMLAVFDRLGVAPGTSLLDVACGSGPAIRHRRWIHVASSEQWGSAGQVWDTVRRCTRGPQEKPCVVWSPPIAAARSPRSRLPLQVIR